MIRIATLLVFLLEPAIHYSAASPPCDSRSASPLRGLAALHPQGLVSPIHGCAEVDAAPVAHVCVGDLWIVGHRSVPVVLVRLTDGSFRSLPMESETPVAGSPDTFEWRLMTGGSHDGMLRMANARVKRTTGPNGAVYEAVRLDVHGVDLDAQLTAGGSIDAPPSGQPAPVSGLAAPPLANPLVIHGKACGEETDPATPVVRACIAELDAPRLPLLPELKVILVTYAGGETIAFPVTGEFDTAPGVVRYSTRGSTLSQTGALTFVALPALERAQNVLRPAPGSSLEFAPIELANVEPPTAGRAVAVGPGGELASLKAGSPWSVEATGNLGSPVVNVRAANGRLYVVQSDPTPRIAVVSLQTLQIEATVPLAPGSDPRDVAVLDASTAVISQAGSAELALLDLQTLDTQAIDLSALADPDGNPNMSMLAHCGARVFVQLQNDTGTPGIGVIDVDASGGTIVDADPTTAGLQPIALQNTPDFEMPIDCGAGTLHVVEPVPLMMGDSHVETVDLSTLTASVAWQPNASGEFGALVMTGADRGWMITHTEFGPSPSSHLVRFGYPTANGGVWDTFTDAHIDQLGHDNAAGLVFFPDSCTTNCFPGRTGAVHVFDAATGAHMTPSGVDVGFPPMEIVVSP